MQAFLISLRDCAQVIRRKTTARDLDSLLNIDLRVQENYRYYPEDLDYEWCGDDTHVVLVGDIIDGSRQRETKEHLTKQIDGFDTIESDYHQIELKILMFINEINKQAMQSGGCIIKLLGNHEFGNMICTDYNTQTFKRITNYNSYVCNPYTGKLEIRILGEVNSTFYVGNFGFRTHRLYPVQAVSCGQIKFGFDVFGINYIGIENHTVVGLAAPYCIDFVNVTACIYKRLGHGVTVAATAVEQHHIIILVSDLFGPHAIQLQDVCGRFLLPVLTVPH